MDITSTQVYYSDSFRKRKNLGWKKNELKIISRKAIYEEIYTLVYKLFENLNILIGGPSNEEIKIIKELIKENKFNNIYIFEPDDERYKELEESFHSYPYMKKIEIIKDRIFNLYEHNIKNYFHAIIVLNIINWKDKEYNRNLLKFFKGVYEALYPNGIFIFSYYIDVQKKAPDIFYIIETDRIFHKKIRKISLGNYTYYTDGNGILACVILGKNELKKLIKWLNRYLNYLEYQLKEIQEKLNFYKNNNNLY